MILRADELQLTRGESVRDTALHPLPPRGRDRPADRRRGRARRRSPSMPRVPVVNMLSPLHHPCQALADLQTLREALGSLEGRVARLRRRRQQRRPLAGGRRRAGGRGGACRGARRLPAADGETAAVLTDDPAEAVAGADAVYTDVWVSMSDSEDSAAARREALAPYAIDDALLDKAGAGRLRAALPARASRARRSPSPCCTATGSGSGIRPRTAATRRRRCSSCSFRRSAGTGRCERPCRRPRRSRTSSRAS